MTEKDRFMLVYTFMLVKLVVFKLFWLRSLQGW